MLTDDLRKLQLRDINVAIGVAIFTVILNSLWVIWEIYDRHQMIERARADGFVVCFAPDIHLMFIRILIALMTSVILLCSRRIIGLGFSALALLWVLLEYLGWYAWSQELLENAGWETFPEVTQHALGMSGAFRWNAVLLAIVSTLFVWELKTLITAFSASRKENFKSY